MSALRTILILSACIVVEAARQRTGDVAEALVQGQQDDFVETHPPDETCSQFKEEVARLNLSAPVGVGLDVLCAEWPVDKWGPFPNMSTTKAIEDFVKDSADYYEKFKALAHTTDKNFCWKHLGYAKKIADHVACPATFHPQELGAHELTASAEIKPNWAGFCTKSCKQMCGSNATRKLFFWCKCPKDETTVTVSRSVRRESVKCPEKVGDDSVVKWGSGCFTTCPAGTNRLNKKMPFCHTDCHEHNEFNTSCGWGCARDTRSCADSTEKMSLYGIEAALDVAAIVMGQLEAIPLIYTLAGLVDVFYEIIEKVVFAVQAESTQVKGLPFMAAASKFARDLLNNQKNAEHTAQETKGLIKKIVRIAISLYDIATGAEHTTKVGPVAILKILFGKLHMQTFLQIYDTFKAFHKPLCPYSTDVPPMESTVNYDGVAPKANIE